MYSNMSSLLVKVVRNETLCLQEVKRSVKREVRRIVEALSS